MHYEKLLSNLGRTDTTTACVMFPPEERLSFFGQYGFVSDLTEDANLVMIFVDHQDDINERLATLMTQIDDDASLWVVIPKPEGSVASDLMKSDLDEYFSSVNWVENDTVSGVSLNDDREGYNYTSS